MRTVIRTDIGKVRSHNEDYVGIFQNKGNELLAVVADGMGGHLAGDVASKMASTLLQKKWEETGPITDPDQGKQWLSDSLEDVNESLFRHAKENLDCMGMGTTIVAAIIHESFAVIAHVGDSRCYMITDDLFQLLTEDHSLVNELVKTGQISKEDAEHHPRKNVLLRALGTETKVEVDIKSVPFKEGNVLLLCSDGLTNKLSDEKIFEILRSEDSLEEKAETFIRLANDGGGEDNITLAIIQNSKAGD